MKNLFTILIILMGLTLSSQNIINQLGNNDGTSKFYINDSDGDSIFVVYDDGGIHGIASLAMPITLISENYTWQTGNYTILCDATNNNITISVPGLPISGAVLNVRRVDAQNNRTVTITDDFGNTFTLNKPNQGVTLQYFIDPAGIYTGWWSISGIN